MTGIVHAELVEAALDGLGLTGLAQLIKTSLVRY
jgi:hypothetical protein